MALTASAREPRYLQLKRELREIILRDLKPGDRVPSEAEVCKQYSVSRTTARLAMSALEYEGRISRQQGRGSFVADEPCSQDAVVESSTIGVGIVSYRLLSLDVIESDLHVANPLARDEKEGRVIRVRSLTAIDATPASYHVLYVPSEFVQNSLTEIVNASPRDIFRQLTGELATGVEHKVTAVRSDELRADILQVGIGAPLLLDERVYSTSEGARRALERTFIAPSVVFIEFDERYANA